MEVEGSGGTFIAPFAFLEVEREMFFDAVKLGEAAFGETPEGLDAIDVSAAMGKGFCFIDADMLVVADVHEAVIAAPAIGEEDAGGIDLAPENGLESLSRAVRDDLRVDAALALIDAEDRLFKGGATAAARTLAPAKPCWTKIGFISLDDADHMLKLRKLMSVDQPAEEHVMAIECVAIEPQEQGRFARRNVQREAFDDSQHLMPA